MLNHEEQVRAALGVSGVSAEVFSWFSKAKEKAPKARGAQIDMLIDRADKTINVCEMKFFDERSGKPITWTSQAAVPSAGALPIRCRPKMRKILSDECRP